MRSGTGVWFNNTVTVDPSVFITPQIVLALYRTINNSPSWPACDGTQYRICSNVDKNWNGLDLNPPTACATDTNCPSGSTCKWKFCSVSKVSLCVADSDCPSGETCSGFMDGAGGYPCMQQPGFGPNMKSMPVYAWNNTYQGSSNVGPSGTIGLTHQDGAGQVQENRDYFNAKPMPGYTPYVYPHPLAACR
jgi:Cys-rich repeat protein